MTKQSRVYIGTSGYSYPHWREVFYPKDLPASKWLQYYARHFNSVELNVTFYRLPQKAVFKNWYQRVPKNFVFVCKGSRFITHIKKLKGVEPAARLFFHRVNLLKEKNGVILWQFPPSWKIDTKRLESFLKILQKYQARNVFEFRNESWFYSDIYELLKKYQQALCIADSPNFPAVFELTADFVYVRLHGSKSLYGSKYTSTELKKWAIKIKKWQRQGMDVYVYFNNDAHGYAVENAKQLKRLIT
jgi:uncharacterized protein YecE (DUF72 family)